MRGEVVKLPWEMPGLDAVEARAHGLKLEYRRHLARRRGELAGAGVLALLLLVFLPSQTGASPSLGERELPLVTGASARPSSSPAVVDLPAGFVYSHPGVVDLPAGSVVDSQPAVAVSQPTPAPVTAASTAPPSVAPGPATAAQLSPVSPTPASTPSIASSSTPPPASPSPEPAAQPQAAGQTYKKDLYDGSLVRYQNPDTTACTAAATEVMLNFIASKGTPDTGFAWAVTMSYDTQESILGWERAHDTLDSGAPGSDPHGWRNALNYYGWSGYDDPGSRHYEDLAYASYAAAVKAAVVAIATENQPVGILAWAGGHAQIMTGYEVTGNDPAVSSDFTVQAVYLTDPLRSDGLLDARISYANFQSGSTTYRFTAYDWQDSGADDPYTPGTIASWREWYGKWVIVAPVSVQAALPAAAPGAAPAAAP